MSNIKFYISFYKKAIVFFVLIIAGDFLIGSLLEYLYFNQKKGIYYETTYSICNTNEEVLIIGASTANRHYDPKIFEDKLGLSCYNTGRDGQGILYFLALQEAIIERYKPKIIILELYFNALNIGSDDYNRMNALLPYYHKKNVVKEIVDYRNNFDNIKMYSKIYPFSSMLATIVNNLSGDKPMNKGYSPLTKNVKVLKKEPYSEYDPGLDTVKIMAFERFIDNCKKNNIFLLVARSPYYSESFFKTKSLFKIEEITKRKNIKILDYSNPQRILDYSNLKISDIMSNATHLNKTGAEFYSEMICNDIKQESLFK